MAMQEFLASYAVEVDADGVNRLREALEGNRDLAEAAASAFEHLKQSMDRLFSGGENGLGDLFTETEDGLSFRPLLDLSGAESSLDDFKARLETLRPALKVNATGIRSAVSSAISSVRSMMASVSVTIPVRAVAKLDTSGMKPGGDDNSPESPAAPSGIPAFGEGGKVEEPTLAMIAEEGEPEYVIPTEKEERAVPLLREALRELPGAAREEVWKGTEPPKETKAELPEEIKIPAAARPLQKREIKLPTAAKEPLPEKIKIPAAAKEPLPEAIKIQATVKESLPEVIKIPTPAPPVPMNEIKISAEPRSLLPEITKNPTEAIPPSENMKPEKEEIKSLLPMTALPPMPDFSALSTDLRELTSAARNAFLPPAVKAGDSYHSVEAPVNIRVSSPSASPEEVGKCVYDMAQRHLLRTIQGVFS